MPSDQPGRSKVTTTDASTRTLGVLAILIAAAILALLAGGGVYWYTHRSGPPGLRMPGPAAFTGRPADRIELAGGKLKDFNLVLVSTDTLRADYVGCYGKRAVRTPVIDGLARQGVLFRQAVSPVPITLASHASMLTGLNPPGHGVRSNGFFRLRAETGTLASMLKRQGYVTGAAVGAFVLDAKFGLNQGFDTYNDDMTRGEHQLSFGFPERRAEQVNAEAIEWLRQHAREKFFLFVHYFDPHFPYAPPPPWNEQYKTNPYEGEIAYVDSQLGRLLAALDELGLRKRTLIVFTSDHGESLGEHGEKTHALLIYDATQLIPLIFSAPPPFPQNTIVSRQVGTVDIVPTVLDLLGVPVPGRLDGLSLLAAPVPGERPIYMETLYPRLTHNWAPLLGIRRSDSKFIYAPKPEVYDLLADAGELNNQYTSRRPLANELFGVLRRMIGGDPDTAGDVKGNLPVDEATRQKLEDLGYVAQNRTSQPASKSSALPDPKDMILASHRLNEAEELVGQGRWKEAAELIRAYLEISPNDPEGCHIAGQVYRQLGQYDEALKWFTRAASLGYQEAEAFAGIGSIYVIRKDYVRAEKAYRKALDIDPRSTTALLGLGTVYGEQNREAEAMKLFRDALSYGQRLNAGMAWVGISNLHRKAGRTQEAQEAIAKAIELEPSNPVIAQIAASLSEKAGNLGLAIDALRKAAESHPTADGLLRLGKLLNQQKRYAEAAGYLSKAISLGMAGPELHYQYGLALLELNQVEQGAAQFLKATELDPKHVGSLEQLGMVFARAGRFQEAEAFMTRAVQARPDSAEAHYNLGLVLANRQAFDRAVQELRKAADLKPDYAKAHTKLGLILAEQGKKAEAVQQYREALRIDPGEAEAKDLLKAAEGK
jgi:arylsulfatase A-like enzyme/Flp pilus assembly protein TadD